VVDAVDGSLDVDTGPLASWSATKSARHAAFEASSVSLLRVRTMSPAECFGKWFELVEVDLLPPQIPLLDHHDRDGRQLDPLECCVADRGPLDALHLREIETDRPGEAAVQALSDAERLLSTRLACRDDADRLPLDWPSNTSVFVEYRTIELKAQGSFLSA
jgi:hypothetical protein